MVHRLEQDYWGKIDFVYLEQFDQRNREVFDRYALVGRPVFVLIEPDGTEVEKWFGARDEAEIRAVLDGYLANTG
jgi:hypothetical protein